jgi:hypothetical protein
MTNWSGQREQPPNSASKVRDVREERTVEKDVNAAYLRWPRTEEAWEAVTWALARDPFSAGPAINESGLVRSLVFEGARSIGMPTVRVVYVIEPAIVIVKAAVFEDSEHMYAGRA